MTGIDPEQIQNCFTPHSYLEIVCDVMTLQLIDWNAIVRYVKLIKRKRNIVSKHHQMQKHTTIVLD